MSMTFSAGGGGNFKNVPAGSHVAVCNMLVDLGIQEGGKFGPKHEIAIRFEFPNERVEYEFEGKQIEGPMSKTKTFTASMNKKANLRKFLEGWRSKAFTDAEASEFDISKLLGVPVMLTLNEYTNREGQTKTDIVSASPLPKGMDKPTAEGDLILYTAEDDSQFDKLPPWVQEKLGGQKTQPVKDCPQPDQGNLPDDDVPF